METREHLRVQGQLSRARGLGVLATLTTESWLQTITDFSGMCAYCQLNPFEVLEHFIPVALAGTTVNNCVPACCECNSKKSDHTGSALINLFGATIIQNISQYLASRIENTSLPSAQTPRYWIPRTKKDSWEFSQIEDKPVYSIEELCDNLATPLTEFSAKSGFSLLGASSSLQQLSSDGSASGRARGPRSPSCEQITG